MHFISLHCTPALRKALCITRHADSCTKPAGVTQNPQARRLNPKTNIQKRTRASGARMPRARPAKAQD
eukprot:498846-Rhodomonas_salina.3